VLRRNDQSIVVGLRLQLKRHHTYQAPHSQRSVNLTVSPRVKVSTSGAASKRASIRSSGFSASGLYRKYVVLP
jgi:hypothetical protein